MLPCRPCRSWLYSRMTASPVSSPCTGSGSARHRDIIRRSGLKHRRTMKVQGHLTCVNLQTIFHTTLWDWVLSPLKYAALPICLRGALRGNLLNFDAPMWKHNYTISREHAVPSHYIYLATEQTCTSLLRLSIHLPNISSEWMRSSFTERLSRFFMTYLPLVYGTHLQSKYKSDFGNLRNQMVVVMGSTCTWRGSWSVYWMNVRFCIVMLQEASQRGLRDYTYRKSCNCCLTNYIKKYIIKLNYYK